MKYLHTMIRVGDLDRSIAFYAQLFGAEPTVRKDDYAKWMLDDPRVNFAISVHDGAPKGIEHVGIQAESEAELAEIYGRIRQAGQSRLGQPGQRRHPARRGVRRPRRAAAGGGHDAGPAGSLCRARRRACAP